jgi:hypothetical protein
LDLIREKMVIVMVKTYKVSGFVWKLLSLNIAGGYVRIQLVVLYVKLIF